jgi:glyoxylase-like metal-dependent hydrolase (beta-lactamase superfamily II)
LGQLQVNCYVIEDVDTGYIAIVDPGDSSTALSKLITEKSDKIKYILLTHGHFDHIGYAKELKSLTNAKVVSTVGSKNNGNQKPFEKMIIMKYDCVGIGVIKMTVGVRRRTHEKVQYCITALQIEKDAITASL